MFANPFIRAIARFYGWVIWIGEHLQSIFLLLLRVTWGYQFLLVGIGKFINKQQVANYFGSLGIPYPEFYTLLVGSIECLGGLLLIAGFASRLISIPLIITLLSALGLAHAHIFESFAFIKDPSVLVHEAPFPFLITAITILLFGPGRFSLDAWIKRLSERWEKF